MSYQALYRAWRPNTFSEICGQDAIVRTLRHQVETGRFGHAYLFCGSRGTGKTTAAKVFARAINCLHPHKGDPCGECEICRAILEGSCLDVQELDAASNNKVDRVRDMIANVQYPPQQAKYKVYIIDEVQMYALSSGSFNALLKTLEEPPAHAVFIMATTEPHKVPATILSRCQRFDFQRIGMDTIVARLRVVLAGIGREAGDEALREIARAAEGALRDALSLLDECLSFTDGKLSAELVRDVLGTTGRDFMFGFVDALLSWDAATALRDIDEAMRRGGDPRVFALDVADHLRALLLAEATGDGLASLLEITPEDAERFREQAGRAGREQLMRDLDLFLHVESEMKWATQPRTLLELAAVRCCHPEQEQDASLAERLARVERKLESGSFIAVPAAAVATEAPVIADEASAAGRDDARDAAGEPAQAPAIPATKRGDARDAAADAAPAPAQLPDAAPPAYLEAIGRLGEANPSLRNMLGKMRFGGVSGDCVTVYFGRDAVTVRRLLERKQDVLEEALSESFGEPMRLLMRTDGEAAPPRSRDAARSAVDRALDVFGRDKIRYID